MGWGMKKLHAPHHKIPTVKWNHWQKKSTAIKCSLQEIKEASDDIRGTTGEAKGSGEAARLATPPHAVSARRPN